MEYMFSKCIRCDFVYLSGLVDHFLQIQVDLFMCLIVDKAKYKKSIFYFLCLIKYSNSMQ
jgi:hypothetical protein